MKLARVGILLCCVLGFTSASHADEWSDMVKGKTKSSDAPKTTKKTLTPGLGEPAYLGRLEAPGVGSSWYASVKVEADLPSDPTVETSPLIDAKKSFWHQVNVFLNVTTKIRRYSLAVAPTIAGTTLPTISVFEIVEDDQGKTSIDVKANRVGYSPWVPIAPGSSIVLQLIHAGSESSNFSLITATADAVSSAASAGGWAVTAAIQPFVDAFAGKIDQGFKNAANQQRAATGKIEINPFGASTRTPESKENFSTVKFTLSDAYGRAIADIKVSMVFRRSLREGWPVALSSEGNYKIPVDTSIDQEPSYKVLTGSGTLDLVSNQLHLDAPMYSLLFNPTGPQAFIDGCGALIRGLTKWGFNANDAAFVAVKYLRTSPAIKDSKYNSIIWTDCLRDQEAIARDIGIASQLINKSGLDYASMDALVRFVTGKKGREAARTALGGAVLMEGSAYTADDLLNALANVPELAGNFHCTEPSVTLDNGAVRRGYTSFLPRKGKSDLVIALYLKPQEDYGAPASVVQLRAPTDLEFALCSATEAARKGPLPVK